MLDALCNLWHDETATASVEYALLLAVVVIGCIGAWASLQQAIESNLQEVQNSLGQG